MLVIPRFTLADPEPVLVDGDGGWVVSLADTGTELAADPLADVETVVIGSAVWRWLRVTDAVAYRPLTLAEVDQHWQLHQFRLAQRWGAHLVVPHVAGHRVHEEEPALVAHVAQAVAEAGATGDRVGLNQAAVLALRGTVRTSGKPSTTSEWDAAGPRPASTEPVSAADLADLAEIDEIRRRGATWIGGAEAELLMGALLKQADLEELSPDEAAAIAGFEQRSAEAVRRLEAQPAELADYRAEASALADVDVNVKDSDEAPRR